MTTFVAVYRGQTVGDARLVAVSADPGLVSDVASRLLSTPSNQDDPVLTRLDAGRHAALRLIEKEGGDA